MRQQVARWAGQGVVLAAAFLAGLLPYLHIFVYHLSRGRTVQDIIVNVILGGDFAGFLGLRSDPLYVLWELPWQQIGLLGLIAAAAGLIWLTWKQRNAASLLGVAYLVNAGFCLFYRVPDIPDFTLPLTLILSIWAGASAGLLSQLGASRRPEIERPTFHAISRLSSSLSLRRILEITLLVVAALSFRHVPQVRAAIASRDGNIEAQGRALLAYSFEPGATVIADWDLAMAVRFLRNVEGVQAGVQVSSVRLGREKGCEALRLALEAGHAVYIAPPVQLTRLPDGYQFEAMPPYLKISNRQGSYVRLDRRIDANVMVEGIQRQGGLLVVRWLVTGSPLTTDYTTYVHYFDATGQAIGQEDKGMGAELSCWYRPTSWPPGQVIQDLYVAPAGTAAIRVGLYTLVDGQVQAQGDAVNITLP